jgi:hypothetical protein
MMWIIGHEQTVWGLIIALGLGVVIGLGANGRWRTWFEF